MQETTSNSITLSNKKIKKATIQKQLLRPGSAATEPGNHKKIYNKMEIILNNENKSVCEDSIQQTQQYSQQFPVIQKQLPISSVKISVKPKTLEFNDSAGFSKKPQTQQTNNKQQIQKAKMSKSSNQFSSAYNKLSDKAKDIVNEEIQKIASGPFKNKKPITKSNNEFTDINLKVVNDQLPKPKHSLSKKLEPIKQVEQEQVSGLLRKSIESTQPSQFVSNDSYKFQFGGDFTALSSQIKVEQQQQNPQQNQPSGNLLMNLLQEADTLSLPPIQTMNDNLKTKQQQQKELQEYLLDIKSRVQFPKNFEKITEDAYSYLRSSRNQENQQWDELVSQSVENSINSSKMLEKRQENDKSKIALLDRVIEAKEREQRELEESRLLEETMSQVSQPDLESKLFLTLQKSQVSQKKQKKDVIVEKKVSKINKTKQENANTNKRYSESYFIELNKELAGKFGKVVRYSELLSEEEQKKLDAMVKDIEISYKNTFQKKQQTNPENEETPFSMSLEVRKRFQVLDKQLSEFPMEENEKSTIDDKIKSKQSKLIADEKETQEMKKKLQEINGKLRSISEVNETIESQENIQKEVEKLKRMNLEIMSSNNKDEVPKFLEAMDRLNELYSEGQNQFNNLSIQKEEIVNSLQQSERELDVQIKVLQNEANEAQKKSAEINRRVDKTTNNKKYSEILQILEQMDNYEDWIKKETDRITSIEERIAKELQEQVYEMAVIPEENNQQQEESKVPLPVFETGKTIEEYEKQFEDEARNESPELFEVDQSDPSEKTGNEEESPLTESQVVQEELAKQRNEIEELKSKVSSFDNMLDTLWHKFSEHKIEEQEEEQKEDELNDSLEEQK